MTRSRKPKPGPWKVFALEGSFHDGQHSHPFSCSVCAEGRTSHTCIALVFGETENQAFDRAEQIVAEHLKKRKRQ